MSTTLRAGSLVAGIATALLAACGSTDSGTPARASTTAMPGMAAMPAGDGLGDQAAGFRFAPATHAISAGRAAEFPFAIVGPDGEPVTAFEPDQTQLMHFYLVRSDLTGFQHVHPTMAADGSWTAPLGATQPGEYRAFVSFIIKDSAGKARSLVLSSAVTVPGDAPVTPLPAPATTTQVDGYTLTLSSDTLMAGTSHEFTVTVTMDGAPVTDLQPYLATYAHLTGFRQGDLAFAHLHPHDAVDGDHGGPTMTFEAMLPEAGTWRLFLQFRTEGVLRTAAVTVTAS
jgi:hypothetical protein